MHAVYNPQKYQPSRGGHAQGHLRDAFEAAIDVYEMWNSGDLEPTLEVGYDAKVMKISEICGLVWNCTDVMPSRMCRQIDDLLPPFWRLPTECRAGSSYAVGARLLKGLINQALADATAA